MAESKDYYSILGVSKDATADDLKKAYRNLSYLMIIKEHNMIGLVQILNKQDLAQVLMVEHMDLVDLMVDLGELILTLKIY